MMDQKRRGEREPKDTQEELSQRGEWNKEVEGR
jgi:hypothetical protein